MPLVKSGTREAISTNIRREKAAGKPQKQAVAIALNTARRYGRAIGGMSPSPPTPAFSAPTQPNIPSGPAAPYYQTGGVPTEPTGLMPVPWTGYGLDMNTGALTPGSQGILQGLAQRGLPIVGQGGAAAAPAAAPAAPTAGLGPPPPMVQIFTGGGGGAEGGNESGSGADSGPGGGADMAAGDGGGGGGGSDSGGGGSRRGGMIGRHRRAGGGGVPSMSEMAPWFTRRDSSEELSGHPSGWIGGSGPGRVDHINTSLPGGSHVIPSDIVSGLGQGNPVNGALALDHAMHTGPGGIRLPSGPHRSTIPAAPRIAKLPGGGGGRMGFAHGGGNAPARPGWERCVLANNEYVLSPDQAARVIHNGKRGNDAVDAWILERRAKDVKTIRKLPPPVGAKK